MTTAVRTRARSLDNRFFGVVVGLVEEVDDPAHEGRIKVKYPWFDEGTVSDWCRVRQLYAGAGYGTFFVPEKGDEVVLAFVHGDMDEPIVLGGLFNGKDKPPTYRDGTKKDEKVIRTKGGHQITLDDSDHAKKVAIDTDGGHSLVMDDQNQNVMLVTTRGHSVVLDDKESTVTITSSGGQTVKIDQSGSITCTGTSVTLSAPQVKLGGDGASMSLVLGEAFMALFNAHVHDVGPVPTTPPVTPMLPMMLSQVTKTV
jgi:phage baseplate assembly protein V